MATAYLYATCAGLVAAALRLIPLGQLAGQRILWALAPSITKLVEEVKEKEMADIWSFAPGIENRRDAPCNSGREIVPIMIPRPLKIGIGGPVGSGKRLPWSRHFAHASGQLTASR